MWPSSDGRRIPLCRAGATSVQMCGPAGGQWMRGRLGGSAARRRQGSCGGEWESWRGGIRSVRRRGSEGTDGGRRVGRRGAERSPGHASARPCDRSAGIASSQTPMPAGADTATNPANALPPSPLSEPLLDAQAAAALLAVRPSWIYEAVRTGRVPHLKIGRHVRFLRSDLEQWVVDQRRMARP